MALVPQGSSYSLTVGWLLPKESPGVLHWQLNPGIETNGSSREEREVFEQEKFVE